MKKVPFTIEFVTTFVNDDELSHLPSEELREVCKRGLIDLLESRMRQINNGAQTITVELVG